MFGKDTRKKLAILWIECHSEGENDKWWFHTTRSLVSCCNVCIWLTSFQLESAQVEITLAIRATKWLINQWAFTGTYADGGGPGLRNTLSIWRTCLGVTRIWELTMKLRKQRARITEKYFSREEQELVETMKTTPWWNDWKWKGSVVLACKAG